MADSKVLGLIFANNHDDSLPDLTAQRALGAIPFGGRYRLIDFPLSNMVNAGISDVAIICKNNYASLLEHVGSGSDWDLARKIGGLSLLPPFSRQGAGMSTRTLEGINGAIDYIEQSKADYIVLCSCDVVANIDFAPIIKAHKESGAGVTMLYNVQEVESTKNDCIVLSVGADGFLNSIYVNPSVKGPQNLYMDIAVCNRDLLIRAVSNASAQGKVSFTKDVLAPLAENHAVNCVLFSGYCDRIHSMESFFSANIGLLSPEARKDLFNTPNRPVYTQVRDSVPAKYGPDASVSNSLIADGSIIEGEVKNSIIFRGVTVGKGAKVENCVLMDNTIISAGADVSYVIADKDVVIRENRRLAGFETYPLYLPKGQQV